MIILICAHTLANTYLARALLHLRTDISIVTAHATEGEAVRHFAAVKATLALCPLDKLLPEMEPTTDPAWTPQARDSKQAGGTRQFARCTYATSTFYFRCCLQTLAGA